MFSAQIADPPAFYCYQLSRRHTRQNDKLQPISTVCGTQGVLVSVCAIFEGRAVSEPALKNISGLTDVCQPSLRIKQAIDACDRP